MTTITTIPIDDKLIPIDDKLLSRVVEALELMARKSTNGESANYATLAGDIESARARHASLLRIQPAATTTTTVGRSLLPPEEREK